MNPEVPEHSAYSAFHSSPRSEIGADYGAAIPSEVMPREIFGFGGLR